MAGKVRHDNGNVTSGVLPCRIMKIMVVGDRGCGKTLFIKKITKRFGNESKEADDAFEHAAVYSANYFIDGVVRNVKIFEIPDVPENETILTKEHYESNGIIFMYAIDNPASFTALPEKWIQTVEENGCKGTQPSILIGNKKDLREDQKVIDKLAENNQEPVTKKQGEDLKDTRRLDGFFETKSTDEHDHDIHAAFEAMMKLAVPHWKKDTGVEE